MTSSRIQHLRHTPSARQRATVGARRWALLGVLALATAAGACGGDDSSGAPTTATPTTAPLTTTTTAPDTTPDTTPGTTVIPTTTTGSTTIPTTVPTTTDATTTIPITIPTTTPTGTTLLPGAATTPVSTPEGVNGPGLTALLVDVRTGRHDGYERVVFEFLGDRVPGYAVQYVDPPFTADPSDLPVAVDGDAFLRVRMAWASGYDLTGDLGQVYTGPDRIDVNAPVVQELVLLGDFEAVLSWVIGVDAEHPFRVTILDEPARIVIDIATSG
ncbi:unannotated protein [freshwater metagenome]|uniref:Unannotated protein n=1 Tax=freshwater metagenome TaxID=449393 RepID=A0A6J6CMS0_9ZZZZ